MVAELAGLAAVALLIFGNGVFVAAEFSLVAVDRTAVERQADTDRRAASVLKALRQLSFQLSGAQLGITVTSLLVGYIAEPALAGLLRAPLEAVGLPADTAHALAIPLALVVAAAAQLVYGELVPKKWAISQPMRVARATAPFQRGFSRVLAPVVRTFNGLANLIVRALGIEPQEELVSARTPAELRSVVRASAEEGALPPGLADLLARTLRFPQMTAEDAMTPRVKLVALRADQPVSVLLDTARSSGFTRFLVYGADIDDVIGMAEVRDAFGVPEASRPNRPLSAVSRPVERVPATLHAAELLVRLRRPGVHLAVVVDEYGGTAGVVTVEDLIEELVGEVADEYDRPRPPGIRRQPDGSVVLAGLTNIDDVPDELGLRLPPGPYETVGGLVTHRLGRLARPNDVVRLVAVDPHDGVPSEWDVRVLSVEGHRVGDVRLTPADGRPPDGGRVAGAGAGTSGGLP
ncbi:MAG: hemolysin family protein [Frankiaceae bacterium]